MARPVSPPRTRLTCPPCLKVLVVPMTAGRLGEEGVVYAAVAPKTAVHFQCRSSSGFVKRKSQPSGQSFCKRIPIDGALLSPFTVKLSEALCCGEGLGAGR